MADSNLADTLKEIDLCIRAGRLADGRSKLRAISPKAVAKNLRAQYARLSWRLGIAELGLRALSRAVREDRQASPEERAEYAACLNSIGSTQEAHTLLLDEESPCAWTSLYEAFTQISMWDYSGAGQTLERLLETPNLMAELPSYNRLVARVNRLACLIVDENWDRATTEWNELYRIVSKENHTRLLANLQELRLQLLYGTKQFKKARTLIEKSSNLEGPERLHSLKWSTLIETASDKSAGPEPLIALKDQALREQRWEMVRDLETRLALHFKNPLFLKRVLYATPWPKYRTRLLAQFAQPVELTETFDYRFLPEEHELKLSGARNRGNWYEVSLSSGRIARDLTLKEGFLSYRTMRALTADLYRSHSVGSLFGTLFPNEHYNPFSSPGRVHHAIGNLRDELADAGTPLTIEHLHGRYRLSTAKPTILHLPLSVATGKTGLKVEKLAWKFGAQQFQVSDAASALALNEKAAQRLLKDAVESGYVARTGSGKATRYQITSSQTGLEHAG